MSQIINYTDFQKVCLTIGQAIAVQNNPSAKIPAYLIHLLFNQDLNSMQKIMTKKDYFVSSAQLQSNHTVEEILQKQLLTVINFPRKQIGKVQSDCLVTGVQKATGTSDEKRESTVFMTTSCPVDCGARVGILAKKELITTNIRNLEWDDFTKLDLRIGTLEQLTKVEHLQEIQRVVFQICLGNEVKSCLGLLQPNVDTTTFLGKQVLVLTNLNQPSKQQHLEASDIDTILCTVGGEAVLMPGKPVENGFRLA